MVCKPVVLVMLSAAAYPILDVMMAGDQGCGCSDLFFRREVGIWKTTCEGEVKIITLRKFEETTVLVYNSC